MKKYIEKLKNLKSTNKKLYIGIICMFLLVGVTFAYVAAQITGGVFKNLNLFADTTDQLLFDVDKDLSLTATQFNFTEGGSNLSDTSIATARLKANSTNKTANYNYNVYLVIEENEFKYTTADKKTEILLQVTDPNGNALTTLDGLTYNSTLQGFDITEEQGILAVAENFAIASNSSTNWTTQNWTFTVTFINLDTNQKENAGKHMSGKIKIQQLTEVGNDITVAVNNLPEAYGPLATLNCKGSDSVYNQKYNRIEVLNISKKQSFCNVTYNDRTEKQYLNDYIIGIEGTTQGSGEVVHETFTNDAGELVDTGYRYAGKEPNNYLWFNNEMWRIIGVMNESSHGKNNQQLIKIIRNDSIGGYSWNNEQKADWQNSSLRSLLNDAYYKMQDGTNKGYCNERSYCDFSATGINDFYRNFIENVKWHLGSFSDNSNDINYQSNAKLSDYYLNERSEIVYDGYASEVLDYIGLIYPSDFRYGSLTCSRTSQLPVGEYCGSRGWINKYSEEWTITPSSDSIYNVWKINENGYSSGLHTCNSKLIIRPSLYLKENIYVINGDGSVTNPYIIGM